MQANLLKLSREAQTSGSTVVGVAICRYRSKRAVRTFLQSHVRQLQKQHNNRRLAEKIAVDQIVGCLTAFGRTKRRLWMGVLKSFRQLQSHLCTKPVSP